MRGLRATQNNIKYKCIVHLREKNPIMKSRKNLDDDAIQAASKQALSC
jgi:hypothetical protein